MAQNSLKTAGTLKEYIKCTFGGIFKITFFDRRPRSGEKSPFLNRPTWFLKGPFSLERGLKSKNVILKTPPKVHFTYSFSVPAVLRPF